MALSTRQARAREYVWQMVSALDRDDLSELEHSTSKLIVDDAEDADLLHPALAETATAIAEMVRARAGESGQDTAFRIDVADEHGAVDIDGLPPALRAVLALLESQTDEPGVSASVCDGYGEHIAGERSLNRRERNVPRTHRADHAGERLLRAFIEGHGGHGGPLPAHDPPGNVAIGGVSVGLLVTAAAFSAEQYLSLGDIISVHDIGDANRVVATPFAGKWGRDLLRRYFDVVRRR